MCPLLPIRKPVLCYVTDRQSLAGPAAAARKLLLEKIENAAKAGVDWIQLREKDLSGHELADLARTALGSMSGASALLINDRLDVACVSGSSGVHLGENGVPVSEARRFAEERCKGRKFRVGISVHSMHAACEAERDGADYAIFGPIFATPSKASFGAPQGLVKLREVCQRLKIPVIAIGGITLENADECLAAGAEGIAAIRLFQDAADLKRVVEQLRNAS